ncbi:hypothetical protein BOX15_Mlig029917g3 [Macrostomum lignano]|uniref:VPS10 domain-containing protein n=1 Tax=Macrostomum lignano TaxID=282301 RepID=A0A267H5C9_9PLAT|nr:hypothetical protein BOX15_Mlig029917g3 [Macrostomum lignano]
MSLLKSIFGILIIIFFVFTSCTKSIDSSPKCTEQQKNIKEKLSSAAVQSKFVSEFIFSNETKPSLLMTWAGNQTLIIVTIRTQGVLTRDSSVYRSTNDGRTFVNITAKILEAGATSSALLVSQSLGLQRNPAQPARIYLACHDPAKLGGATGLLYYTLDGGATWHLSSPGFPVQSAQILFHTDKPDWLLAQAGDKLYLSVNAGQDWRLIKKRVFKASWGVSADDKDSIYAAFDGEASFVSLLRDGVASSNHRLPGRQLAKLTDFTAGSNNWKTLAEKIYSYNNKDGFIFISKSDEGKAESRHLEVSTDCGKTFVRTQLPSATPDRFFVILDTSDGLAFVHIDAGNYLGYGTLYTSNSLGQVFSKSLERNFYPPLGGSSDFYKVESMRGAFLSTVLHSDASMHSVITHNRGAVWRHLSKPDGVTCTTTDGGPCYLQVASYYSISRSVPADQPRSAPSAVGLLIVHGHTAAKLQSNPADVYISSDGGYSWYLALKGPHRVQIGNNGNFLVAVEKSANGSSPQVVKFSTDAGRCWHSHRFTTEDYVFTGLLTEPGNRALTVAIWGYVSELHHWRVFVVDLGVLLSRSCTDSDYESWLSNGAVNYDNANHQACVLGAKETIKRLKADSMCASTYSYKPQTSVTPCECTKDDFECEFGYTRPVNSLDCVRDPDVPTPRICDANTVKKIITEGYRKLPRNRCQGGFQPNVTHQEVLHEASCPQPTEDPRARDGRLLIQSIEQQRQQAELDKTRRTVGLMVPLAITVAILLAIVLSLVVLARHRERRRRRLAFHYSIVSAAGRRGDEADGEDVEYQAADDILQGGGGSGGFYNATGATERRPTNGGGKMRASDKQALLGGGEDDEAPIF